ncbi:conserved hypothetical protein [Rubrivivax sp. A210]|uniref:hypothetical protein n=1 Tax=Rubrivivax sp. A210 TaxID=2772301 RepID=UPI00191B0573|nr:hypothetical protein [Rubrivivax sp. A210]CAD5373550.1 conserved hypothetical protein [Rubrivivax sp. A210]
MPIPIEIATRFAIWDSSAYWNTVAGGALIAVGVLASAGLVAFPDQLEKKYIKVLGFVAAVCTALIAAFNPLSLGFAFRDAWRVLDSAILRHNSLPEKYPIETVIEAVEKGEVIISQFSKTIVKSPEAPASGARK